MLSPPPLPPSFIYLNYKNKILIPSFSLAICCYSSFVGGKVAKFGCSHYDKISKHLFRVALVPKMVFSENFSQNVTRFQNNIALNTFRCLIGIM